MSYILDALRRADAERERGLVPGLHAQPAASATAGYVAGQRSWRRDAAAVGTALLLLSTLLAGWYGWRAFGADGGAGADTSGKAIAALTSPAVTASSAGAGTLPDRPAPERSAPVQLERPSRPVGATATVAAPVERPARRTSAPTVTPPAGSRVAAAALPLPVASASAAASAPARVYAVEELPEDVRRSLPRLAIGGSIYSQSPSSRFVIVNGQLFHEGDTVAPGLVLQQIKLRSAVLAFQGYRYGINY